MGAEKIVAQAILDHLERCQWQITLLGHTRPSR
jgi:hypothetical protein